MNYLGHAHVALASGEDVHARYILGAVLPDVASMAGVRVQYQRLPEPMAAGVRHHQRADAVFHAHPAFRQGMAALRGDLAAAGLAGGAARAVGHVGWELLADGALLGSPAEVAYWQSLALGDEVRNALDGSDQERWARLLDYRERRPVLRYDEPAWVAARLHAILDRRPRLRFPAPQVAPVCEVLARHAVRVRSAMPGVLQDVGASLHDGESLSAGVVGPV